MLIINQVSNVKSLVFLIISRNNGNAENCICELESRVQADLVSNALIEFVKSIGGM